MGLEALKILIVDDNAQMRTIIGTVLSAAGVRHLHYAPDGRKGLETLDRIGVDVVYVDYEMPVMNGLEFISAVRARAGADRFLPIIMLTGHSDLPRLHGARDRGVTEFLTKPVTAKTILTRLGAVIYHPRPFVISAGFFGPDRRRRSVPDYSGPLRRAGEGADSMAILEL
ncbi:response regulator [Phenylobacterium sp.]|uniref:response regulator n=1 Tax=Phenylobacterium sp. TaxID=1871053 RepID=UPI002FC5E6A6